MILNTSDVKNIYLCTAKVDFRKQIDGLVAFISHHFDVDILDRSLFIFINRNKSKLKIIYYDGSGFWLLSKRMEKGKFKMIFDDNASLNQLSSQQLSFLLEGLDFSRNHVEKK